MNTVLYWSVREKKCIVLEAAAARGHSPSIEIFPTERQLIITFCFREFSKRTISTEHVRSYVITNKITTFIISYV
jgi:hypothetical protein